MDAIERDQKLLVGRINADPVAGAALATQISAQYKQLGDVENANIYGVIAHNILSEPSQPSRPRDGKYEGQGIDPSSISFVDTTGKTFANLAGMTAAKDQIMMDFIRPLSFPGVLKASNNMLLWGPPGTGKTMIANHVAGEIGRGVKMVQATGADVKGKYVGETEKNIRAYFEAAQDLARGAAAAPYTVLFMDEIDALASKRDGNNDNASAVVTLLQYLSSPKYDKVLFVGATNFPWDIDSAIMRRFKTNIFIDLPSDEARRAIILMKIVDRTKTRSETCVSCEMFKQCCLEWSGMSREGRDQLKGITRAGDEGYERAITEYGYSSSDLVNAMDTVFNRIGLKKLTEKNLDGDCYPIEPDNCALHETCKKCSASVGREIVINLRDIQRYGGQTTDECSKLVSAAFRSFKSTVSRDEYRRHLKYNETRV